MEKVIRNFVVASMFMWTVPMVILYGFKHKIFPGSGELSSSSHTLVSGFVAVIAVNVVIAFYIAMALKERPTSEPQPDAKFLAEAKASMSQKASSSSTQTRDKEE